MPEPRPTPARSATDLAARITHQAARLGSALDTREQRTDTGGPEHDHGLHTLARRLLASVGQHTVRGQAPTADAMAQLVRDAEPLREALALREDADTRRRDTDWELHSLAYTLLTTIDVLSAGHRDIDAHVDAALRERQRAKPFSESVAVLANQGVELPSDVIGALRTDPGA
ncbi:hypothetical protein HLK59_29390 [Streptomyces sp. S3(2020)]|uniref:hypothetical protein n=1 Tax=Streptomyces sp. S3(2020) TaxID=2732044 RepID=UPI00148920F3|nr:hypothetical protein [Streptomyces sp. S3(2020)]NNN34404.1 hypothetical protein [Streptomyces sp. S3(2020)]